MQRELASKRWEERGEGGEEILEDHALAEEAGRKGRGKVFRQRRVASRKDHDSPLRRVERAGKSRHGDTRRAQRRLALGPEENGRNLPKIAKWPTKPAVRRPHSHSGSH